MKGAAVAVAVSIGPHRSEASEAIFDARLRADPTVGLPPAPNLDRLPPAPKTDGLPSAPRMLDERLTAPAPELPAAPEPLAGFPPAPEVNLNAIEKRLHLYNVHTKEEISVTFFNQGYLEKGIQRLNYFMRDWRADSVCRMDRHLFDLLHALQTSVGDGTPFCVLSGYRTAATNAMLARVNPDVARRSLHIAGQAADIYMPGCKLETLRDCALALRAGGVGYYPDHGFLHIDTGRFRTWS